MTASQRGGDEKSNGLLRQYFPKGTNFDAVDPTRLDEAADSLNRRPRETLGWKSPGEAHAETVARTDFDHLVKPIAEWVLPSPVPFGQSPSTQRRVTHLTHQP